MTLGGVWRRGGSRRLQLAPRAHGFTGARPLAASAVRASSANCCCSSSSCSIRRCCATSIGAIEKYEQLRPPRPKSCEVDAPRRSGVATGTRRNRGAREAPQGRRAGQRVVRGGGCVWWWGGERLLRDAVVEEHGGVRGGDRLVALGVDGIHACQPAARHAHT